MNKIKVLPLRKFFPQDINYLCSKFLNSVELIELESYDEEKIYEYLLKHKVDVLLGEPQSEKILSVSNNVKLIQLPWTGVDRLNFSLFKKFPHINICNSHSNALAVAEYAVSLMMSLMKQLPYHDKNLREGDWCRPSPQKPEKFKPPVYISGSHIGIIGFGEIGQLIQKFLQPYSCEFHILIRNLSKYSKRNADDISFYDHSKLKEFIKNVDVLFVSTPLTLETKEMINQDFLKLMKESSYIINISRGEIISEKALYESLKTKSIAGAAIDTWYNYSVTSDNGKKYPSIEFPFHDLENLIMSPHRAGFIKDQMPHLDDAILNINNLSSGKDLINVIDLNTMY